jgi:signal transduction histidine kinase
MRKRSALILGKSVDTKYLEGASDIDVICLEALGFYDDFHLKCYRDERPFEAMEKSLTPEYYQIGSPLKEICSQLDLNGAGDPGRLGVLLSVYAYLSQNKEHSYNYFIRPQIHHSLYSGLLLLTASDVLTSEQYAITLLIVSLVFSETLAQNVRQLARRSAIAAVMARNMSHNIGSHVLVNLVTPKQVSGLRDTPTAPTRSADGQRLRALLVDVGELVDLAELNQGGGADVADKWKNYQIASLNSYLKSRMDYLADLATSAPTLQNNALLARQVLGFFVRNKPLVNNISGIDEFEYSIKAFDCTNGRPGLPLRLEDCEEHEKHDMTLAFPNDVLGHQAFYNILENLIRNVAKHGSPEGVPVVFRIEISKCKHDDSLYEVLVYDSIPKGDPEIRGIDRPRMAELTACAKSLNKEEPRDVEDVEYKEYQRGKHPNLELLKACAECLGKEITEVTEIEYQVYRLNTLINDGVIGQDGRLRKSAWGLIEMDVSAAYLRKISPNEVDEEKYNLVLGSGSCEGEMQQAENKPSVSILKAAVSPINSLGYRFHMLKPANYLVVGEYGGLHPDLMKSGIKVVTRTDLEASGEIYPHEFLLTDEEIDSELQTSLPIRQIRVDQSEGMRGYIEMALKDADPLPRMAEIVWGRWIQYIFDKRRVMRLRLRGGLNEHADEQDWVEGTTAAGMELEAKFDDHVDEYDEYRNNRCAYYEPLSSQGRGLIPARAFTRYDVMNIDRPPELIERGDPILQERIAESVLLRVGVIDERVQSALKQDYRGILLHELYPRANIFVPDPQRADLNKSEFGNGQPGSVKAGIESWLDTHLGHLDALIIHIGILEKMLPGSSEDNGERKIMEYLKEKIIDVEEYKSVHIVLTSGRGQPHNLPPEVRFVNFSALMDCLVLNRSKFVLTNLIYSSRRLKR